MKGANQKWVLAGGMGLILFLIFFGLSQCEESEKKFSWRKSYSKKNDHPFGSYLVYQQLDDLFTDDSIEIISQRLFDQLVYEFPTGVNYILINAYSPLFEEDWEELLSFIERGNHVFMALDDYPESIGDETGLYPDVFDAEGKDSVSVRFISGNESPKWFDFPMSSIKGVYFESNAPDIEVLAETRDGVAVFVRKRLGSGWLYFSSCPRIFTNYYMVHPANHEVISRMLSYLPTDDEIWWDEFYKPNNLRMYSRPGGYGQGEQGRDKLDFILEQESLRWAFWLSLLGLLLYALFEGKRKQRLIPIIKPLPNMTLDFTETIGRLYFQSKDHKNIAEKRIRTLLAHIREHYYLKTEVINESFLQSLAAKSGMQLVDVQLLFRMIKQVRESEEITETKLIELSINIDHFYRRGGR